MGLSKRKVAIAFGVGALLCGLGSALARPLAPSDPSIAQQPPISPSGSPATCIANPQADLEKRGIKPAVGIYRVKVTVTTATAGCGFQPGGIPVPEYTYYYPGEGQPAKYYIPSVWNVAQVYIEKDYMTPNAVCPASGKPAGSANATAEVVPPLTTLGTITYSEAWTYIDVNSFVVKGHYINPGCVADETIVFIRTGGDESGSGK